MLKEWGLFIIVLSRQCLYEDRSENVELELLDFQPVLSAERNRIGRKQGENEMLGRKSEMSIRR